MLAINIQTNNICLITKVIRLLVCTILITLINSKQDFRKKKKKKNLVLFFI